VKTDIKDGKGGTSGPILVKLIGDIESEWVSLAHDGFMTSNSSFDKKLPVVGDIEIIQVKNMGFTDWVCQSITFTKVLFKYNFNCS